MRNIDLAICGSLCILVFTLVMQCTEQTQPPSLAEYKHPVSVAWTDSQEAMVKELWK